MSGILFLCFINDLLDYLPPFVSAWLFADDLKLAIEIVRPHDARVLQHSLDCLFSWCQRNLMELNIEKCKHMSFHNKKKPHLNRYHINGTQLEQIFSVRDLGVYFHPSLKFNLHYEHIINKSYRMLGFLLRNTRDFVNPKTLIVIYYAYVRSHVEYCSSIWSPQYQVHINAIESIQRKFLRHLAFKQRRPIENHDYSEIMSANNIMTLEKRRDMIDLTYFYKILNNQINCPDLLNQVNIRVSARRTRFLDPFETPSARKDLGMHSPFVRMHKLANDAERTGIDLFNCHLNEIRRLFD